MYRKAERIWLKDSPEFNEAWLQQQVATDTSILGLGDLDLIQRERSHGRTGRLDLLLADPEQNRRYEVELMLGATDPSHIIRTIEYWDIERRRYPAYDHVAVLVAEDITSRFLNVISLLSGSIPLIAIQLNALKVGDDAIVLDFVRALDQTELRVDDEAREERAPTDRGYWEQRSSQEVMRMLDTVLEIVNEKAQRKQNLNYNRGYIGLNDGARTRNFLFFRAKQKSMLIGASISDQSGWLTRLSSAGLDVGPRRGGLRLNVTRSEFDANRELVKELVHAAAAEFEE